MASYYGFQQEWLPGNPLNASVQGYSTFLTGNMPTGFALDSIRASGYNPDLINYLNATQDRVRTAAEWDRIMQQNRQAALQDNPQDSQQTSQEKSGLEQMIDYWKYRAQGYSQEEAEKKAGIYQANQDIKKINEQNAQSTSFCDRFGESGLQRAICDAAVDGGKRIGVSVIGVLLIALGVWSLR